LKAVDRNFGLDWVRPEVDVSDTVKAFVGIHSLILNDLSCGLSYGHVL